MKQHTGSEAYLSFPKCNHEGTKSWFDKLTTGACPEPVEGCFRVFVADVGDIHNDHAPPVADELVTRLPPPGIPDTQRVSCENDLGELCGFCGEELR